MIIPVSGYQDLKSTLLRVRFASLRIMCYWGLYEWYKCYDATSFCFKALKPS